MTSHEALFVEHLGWIDKVASVLCQKHGMWGTEAEDFAAWVKIELIRDDYATFRNYRGEAGLKTYLATVITRRFYEYVRERRGRWRASMAAERMGGVAKELEALVYRDGFTLAQAGEKLRTAGRTTATDTELARVLDALPQRGPMRPVEVPAEPVLGAAAGHQRADQAMDAEEADEQRRIVMDALGRALGRLEPEDRMIMRMHFGDGRKLADVARALRMDQKPLYRRVDRLRARLREQLEAEGVRGSDVREMLGGEQGP